MTDRDPPRLIVTNSEADLERQEADRKRTWAEEEVEWTLRHLAANLMRVVRGAGKPYDIAGNAQAFIQALVKYRDTTGHLAVMEQFPAMLSAGAEDPLKQKFTGANLMELRAQDRAIRGALQTAASRLLGQATQRSAGETELSDGARQLIEAYAKQTREWDRKAKREAKPIRPAKPTRRT